MQFLNLVASEDQHAPIKSELLPDAVLLRSFARGDSMTGKIKVVSETGDPTNPTVPVDIDTSMGIGLTDGVSLTYAAAVILAVTNNNELNFTIMVASDELTAALNAATEDWIPAFFEVRITKDGQDDLLLRTPTTINKAASGQGGLGPATAAMILLKPLIDHLRGDPSDTSLEGLATTLLPTYTFLIISPGGDTAAAYWQLLPGAADGGDPDGQVAPLDYNDVTNNRHWVKVGGF